MDTRGISIIIAAYVIGAIASIVIIRQILRHEMKQAASAASKRIIQISGIIGVLAALFPSVYFGFLFGGNFGGAIGAASGELLHVGSAGVPIGIFAGISIVFTFTLVLSLFIAMKIARTIIESKKTKGPNKPIEADRE